MRPEATELQNAYFQRQSTKEIGVFLNFREIWRNLETFGQRSVCVCRCETHIHGVLEGEWGHWDTVVMVLWRANGGMDDLWDSAESKKMA